jgi:hypothetical protein
VRAWQGLSAALAWALGLALWWGWRRGRAVAPAPAASRPTAQPLPLGAIKRALTEGDLRTIADALRAATTPPSPSLGALHAKLEDPAQRAAVVALDRVMWAATADARDKEAARALLRSAFRNAPRVACAEHAGAAHELPPLYPERI